MEGSAGKPVDGGDPRVILEHAGLPHRGVVLWLNARPQFRDKFKRDAAAGARFWRAGTNLLAKLPKKPQRSEERSYFERSAATIITICVGTPCSTVTRSAPTADRVSCTSKPRVMTLVAAFCTNGMN